MARSVTPHPTPNPNAIRFALSEPALGEKSRAFGSAESAHETAWAARLFALPGVVGLFGMRDFLTITKAAAADWNAIIPKAVEILATSDLGPARGV